MKETASVADAINHIYNSQRFSLAESLCFDSPLIYTPNDARPCSATVEDCSFGDSGKGNVMMQLNQMFAKTNPDGTVFSYRYNGSANAGHEIWAGGERIAMHQLPIAVAQEKATAIMGRGMLIHPTDLVTEVAYVSSKLGSTLPGTLLIDQNTPVTTNIHRAWETMTNKKLEVGHGATGSGVAQGYAEWYEKRALTMRDLVAKNWKEAFAKQYRFYEDLMGKEEFCLSNMQVNALTFTGSREKHAVGTLGEYLDQLETARDELSKYVADVRFLVENVWRNTRTPFSFEGAQGGALDPYHGVYPDVTASRPIGRIGIPDSTEGVVLYDEIAMPMSTIKVPYISSVGSRVPPYEMDNLVARMYREENDEYGRSTGRARSIYPIDLPVMQHIQRVAGYRYLAVTHLDSAHPDIPIEIITHYVNKRTGKIQPYRPYQWHWDEVEGVKQQIPSWDGPTAKHAQSLKELPHEALQFMELLGRVLAPVALVTNGPKTGDHISFLR